MFGRVDVFVYVVHPVATSAVFCVFCSLCPILMLTIWWKCTEYGSCYGFVCASIVSFCVPPPHVVDR